MNALQRLKTTLNDLQKALEINASVANYFRVDTSLWHLIKKTDEKLDLAIANIDFLIAVAPQDLDFAVGDYVRKTGGSYEATGTIVAAFRTKDGKPRYVFEFEELKGMLHIFGPDNLINWDKYSAMPDKETTSK